MKYIVIHTYGRSVECAFGCDDRRTALDKALEIAVRSGFFEPEDVDGISQAQAIENARDSLARDDRIDGESSRYDQRITVKRVFMISPALVAAGKD